MNFDIGRLRRSDQIIGASAIAFLIFLFLFKWYGGSSSASAGGVSFSSSANGWHTFTVSRWIWIVTIIVAVGAVALKAAQRELNLPLQPGVLIAGLGALSTLLIVYRIVHHPSGGATVPTINGVNYSYSYGIKIGIWLGLIAAAILTYGGYLAMQAEGTSLSDVRDQASDAFSGLAATAATEPAATTDAAAQEPAQPTPPSSAPPGPEPSGTSAA